MWKMATTGFSKTDLYAEIHSKTFPSSRVMERWQEDGGWGLLSVVVNHADVMPQPLSGLGASVHCGSQQGFICTFLGEKE